MATAVFAWPMKSGPLRRRRPQRSRDCSAVVIDSTGRPSGAPLALRLLPAAGRLTVVGLPDTPACLDLLLAFKEITVRGSLVYDEHDFAAAVAHIAAGRIPCDRITKITPLDSAPAIVAELRGGATDHVKVLLTP